ncbi:MAG: sulfotransferase [Thermoleophilia bacterium]|nr:sulfotransferase [Thermoleophilia bacterium]
MTLIRSIRKAAKDPRRAWAEVRYRLLRVAGSTDYRRFIVLSRARTGSKLLMSLLRSHPQIRADGEVFSRLKGRDLQTLLAKTFSKQPRYIKARGFKIFYYHPQDDPSSRIWEELRSIDDLHVIHLKRRNTLRTLLSHKIAEAEDVWVSRGEPRPHGSGPVRVTFTVDELAAGFEQTRAWEESGDETFSGHRVLTVYYEDLVSDRDQVFRAVTDFLGVEYVSPRTQMTKQNPGPIKDAIANYEELRAAFADTEWAPFFDE